MIVYSFIISLIHNIALLISVVLLYDYFWVKDAKPKMLIEKFFAGLVVGGACILLMATPWVMQDGLIFDVRTVMLSVCGLFLGPIPTLTGAVVASAYRIGIGGPGVYMGVLTILTSAMIGILWKHWRPRWWTKRSILELLAMGYLVHLIMLICILALPHEHQAKSFNSFVIPGLTIYPIATILFGKLLDTRVVNWKNKKNSRELESLYMSLVEQIPAGLFRKNKEGRYVYVNELFCKLKGLTKEEIVGKTPQELYDYEYLKEMSGGYPHPPVQRTIVDQGEAHHAWILKHGKAITVHEVYPQANGVTRHFRVVKTPILDSYGKVVGSQGMQFDITAAQQVEDALRQEQYLLATFLDNSNDCIFFKDAEGRFLRVNKTQLKLLGVKSEKEVIGKTDFDFFTRIHAQKSMADEMNIMKTGDPIYNVEERLTWIDNRQMWMITSRFPFRNKEGLVVGTFGVSKDITPQKNLENDLLTALKKVEESDRLKSAFLHNISHEIRTPMNSIIGFSGLLKDPEIDPSKKDHMADIVVNSSNQLLSIIDDIVRIATVESGQERLNESITNINSVLQMEYEKFAWKSTDTGIELSYIPGLPDEDASILVDQTKLIQTLNNLLVNAFKFTTKGFIRFGYIRKGNFLEFFVEDTGIGVPADKHEIIFKRFSQVDNRLTRQFGGSGLGLSICKAYIELMGGSIGLKSSETGGSIFYFTLPYHSMAHVLVDPKPAVPKTSKSDVQNTKTLLVAEDEEMNFLLLRELLGSFDLSIVRAVNGQEALALIESNDDIDLVLMDLKMPVMDGFEATLKIKNLKPNIPVLALTAYSQESDRRRALECGCSEVLVKPVDKTILCRHLKNYINGLQEKEKKH